MTTAKLTGAKDSFIVHSVLATASLVGAHVELTDASGPVKFCSASGVQVEKYVVPILRYFGSQRPELGLCGFAARDVLSVDYWLARTSDMLSHAAAFCPTAARSEEEKKKAVETVKLHLDIMNKHLLHHTFLAQERISVADILAAFLVNRTSACPETAAQLNVATSYPNVQRWLSTMLAQDALKKHVTCAKGSCSSKAGAGASSSACPAKSTDSKQQSAEEIEAQIESDRKAREKNNPLDALPPTSFVLDAWKREYSNSKDLLGTSMPYFWKNIDLSGWSLWHMKYNKVPGENTVGYAASNMLSGFLQRLDPNLRKYSFAVVNVMGKDGDFEIEGVWLMRGQELPAELTSHPSYEYHTFRKLDAKKDKAMIEDYWTKDEAIEGRPIDSCKVWK